MTCSAPTRPTCARLVDLRDIRPLNVVVDAGNGMGGYTVPAVLGADLSLPLKIIPLYFELDGTFPNHEANPLEPANLVDLQRAVRSTAPTSGSRSTATPTGASWSTSAVRPVSPSAITALVAVRELAKAPGRVDHPQPDHLARGPGDRARARRRARSVRRVGHSFIKAEMARTGAVFGGEHSAHYYFKDFWGADTGMLAAMHVLAALGEQGRPLSALVREYEPLRRFR